jgi:hypothetical protein
MWLGPRQDARALCQSKEGRDWDCEVALWIQERRARWEQGPQRGIAHPIPGNRYRFSFDWQGDRMRVGTERRYQHTHAFACAIWSK